METDCIVLSSLGLRGLEPMVGRMTLSFQPHLGNEVVPLANLSAGLDQ